MLLRPNYVFATLLALTALAVPATAFAQTAPADAPPSYARPAVPAGDEAIKGSVASFDGGYKLQLHDDRGFIDNVQLQPGTIINPTGLRLEPGMTVTIHGVNRGATFAATQIDLYESYSAVPVYPVVPYAYPVYPYPIYAYPYGPTVSFGFRFGPGWHHW